jgi:hypothetical protein
MSNDPFIKAFEDLLEDQINTIDFETMNPEYANNENRKDKIIKILESLPKTMETKAGTVKVHQLLLEFQDLHHDSIGICFDIAVKRGFSLAFKLILHNLTII